MNKYVIFAAFLSVSFSNQTIAKDVGIDEVGVFAIGSEDSSFHKLLRSDKFTIKETQYLKALSDAAVGLNPGEAVIASVGERTYTVAITAYTLGGRREYTGCKTLYWLVIRTIDGQPVPNNAIVNLFSSPVSGSRHLGSRIDNEKNVKGWESSRTVVCSTDNGDYMLYKWYDRGGFSESRSQNFIPFGLIKPKKVSDDFIFKFQAYDTYLYGLPVPSP